MKRRAFVSVTDDAQMNDIDGITERLRSAGGEIAAEDADAGRVTGQFPVTADENDLPRVREQATSIGLQFTPEEDDIVHRLPDPSSDLQ